MNMIKFLFILLVLFLLGLSLFFVLPIQPERNPAAKLGITFSTRAAEYLELDWKSTYQAMIDDLDPDVIRIPVYWNRLEANQNQFVWDEFDFQLDQLAGKDTEVILAIGHKLPRWPECHLPEWVDELNESEIESELLEMITAVVERYKNNPNLYAWQIENEVLFPFGECPEWSNDRKRLKKSINLVKKLDPNHKVLTSDSGELSGWIKTSTLPIDVLGISLYRAVFDPTIGYFYWPVNPYFYSLHIKAMSLFVDEVIITELQLEPWGPLDVQDLSTAEAYKSFSSLNFDERIEFAERTGATTILGWGVEWWYYMKEMRNIDTHWNKAIEIFNN